MQNEAILRLTSSVSPQVNKPTVIDHTHMVNNNAELQERFDDLVKEFNSLGVSHDQQREILEKQRSLLLDLDRDRQRLQTTLEERTLELERLQSKSTSLQGRFSRLFTKTPAAINNGLTLQISTLRQQMDSAQNNANAALAQLNRRRDDVIDTQGQLAQLMAEKEALATQLKVGYYGMR